MIELRHADKAERARALVETYVISDEMADRLKSIIIPNLQFETPSDNKGLLVVGNYGTGKSHLMAVLSALAENAELLPSVRNNAVRTAAGAMAGRFKVVRTEIGSTKMPLRDIIVQEIESHLAELGVAYSFPPAETLRNHKGAFEEMMRVFHEEFPDHGLLMVVDELLDYLRSRNAQDLILDLGFLREVGEVCKDLRFRFVAGVQEAIFNNQRFSFVADDLRRVQARFDQILIASRDIKYVVAERLLQKSADQQSKIRAHLSKFTKFYGRMNEQLDEFVRLFPIHPDYFSTFERVQVAEKREVLKTISHSIKRVLNHDVPTGQPGLIAYDQYWATLSTEPSLRAVPEIRDVITCATTLEDRIDKAFTRPQYKPLAKRIIHALSVHRLTTGDIYRPLGATPEELRDGLCLFQPGIEEMGGDPAEDLLTQVEAAIREIHKTVSGQFLTINKENRQAYLDLRKTDDYDALIDKRAETLSDDQLNRYYYTALKQAMELTDVPTQVTGFHLWQRELEWRDRMVTRRGYLFFGTPNERATAIPVRDFYIYFLQPFDTPVYKDEQRQDEMLLRLDQRDETFTKALRGYAGALEQSASASGQAKDTYDTKARGYLKALVAWLRENATRCFEVTHQGKSKSLLEWLKGGSVRDRLNLGPNQTADFRQIIDLVGSVCLSKWFEEQAPEYPTFTRLLTAETRRTAVADALRAIAGGPRTQQANAVLDALELLDGDKIQPTKSRYANLVLTKLKAKGQGQVVNRSELLEDDNGVEYFAVKPFRLEPELLLVVLAALVHGGHLVLSIPGDKIDATKLGTLAATPLDDALQFKHIEQPKDLNLPAIRALFDLLGLGGGLANNVAQGQDKPVTELQDKVAASVKKLVEVRHQIAGGVNFWKAQVIDEAERDKIIVKLDAAKAFLESLQAFNSPGKLKNFRHDEAAVKEHEAALATLTQAERLVELIRDLMPEVGYISEAELVLPVDHPWMAQVTAVRNAVIAELKDDARRTETGFVKSVKDRIGQLKRDYVKAYSDLHTRARLGPSDDSKRSRILRDDRLDALRMLVTIDLLNKAELTDLQNDLNGLKECSKLTETELEQQPICPHCNFRPAVEKVEVSASQRLDQFGDRLDRILLGWTQNLYLNLKDPTVKESLELLPPEQKGLVEDFLEEAVLPDPVDARFVTAVSEALKGLQKVVLTTDQIRDALLKGGSPAGIEDLKERFKAFLDDATKGKEKNKVRVVIAATTTDGKD
ncbi:hypothetical protein M2351_002786 [Azospirillum canadense]|nr:hypothetical protein [Azospirillum canadense]